MYKCRIFLLFVCCYMAGLSPVSAQRRGKAVLSPRSIARARWVDSIYATLTTDERIGQLMMVPAYSGGKNFNEELITQMLAAHQIGGITFMQGGPVRQALLTNKYQQMAQVPLLVSMDAEWGLGMRLDSIKSFPRQMMLGAAHDTGLVRKVGLAIAYQCKRMGVHLNFAPDVDVNNNAANPVINSRSYGEDKNWVSKLGIAYMSGLQQGGVMACAKHFPGHGNTSVDSHNDLPLITSSLYQLDTVELQPFRQMIAAGVRSVMVAHLEVPALDTALHVPTTLSYNAVTGLLRNRLGYSGLIITDALAMQGVTKYFPSGEAALRAFKAGNDILLFPQDVPMAIARIHGALDSGQASTNALEASVKKILAAKYDAGLHSWKNVDTAHLVADLNQYHDQLRLQTARGAVTLVKDDNQILKRLNENMRIGYVGINVDTTRPLYEALQAKFMNIRPTWAPKGSKAKQMNDVLDGLEKYDAAIVAVHNVNFSPANNYGLSDAVIDFLAQATCRSNVLVVLLGNAYAMQYFCGAQSVVVAYEDDSLTESAVADVLLRKTKARGKLPVTSCLDGKSVCPVPTRVSPAMKAPPKEPTFTGLRKVLYPPDAGVIDQGALGKLDLFMARCIADGAFPGGRILAAREGKIFYDKAFGYLKYDKQQPVDTNTLYDMASCTKVLATTLAVMRLYEQGKLDLDKKVGDYLPAAAGTNKAGLVVKDLLLHQAGLKSWIPFYKEMLDEEGQLKKGYCKVRPKPGYGIQVTPHMFLRNDYSDTVWKRIYDSPLENLGKSVYSDLDYFFLAAIVEQITGTTIDKYTEAQFYKPMGLRRILYNPLTRFDTLEVAPTEIDVNFRQGLVYGCVHDPGAAMLGGIAGHAGLFATAADVAAIFQMLLNKGMYTGNRYFKATTVAQFTAYQSKLNHRGLGFDKPATDADDGGPAGARCSALAFGHQGFTGTCAWADPATGVVFVFLSNRVYPSATNTKINRLNVRTMAQDLVYESLGIPVNHDRLLIYKSQVLK